MAQVQPQSVSNSTEGSRRTSTVTTTESDSQHNVELAIPGMMPSPRAAVGADPELARPANRASSFRERPGGSFSQRRSSASYLLAPSAVNSFHMGGMSRASSQGDMSESEFGDGTLSLLQPNTSGTMRSNGTHRNSRRNSNFLKRHTNRQAQTHKNVFRGHEDVSKINMNINPTWLTFRDDEKEAAYAKWFYEDSGFNGGKIWSMLVVSLDIWFLTYYHEGFAFNKIFNSAEWGPMSAHIIFSALLGLSLFFQPLKRYREILYLCSLASHWPAVTIAIVWGKHPHTFIYFYIILCYFFCAFTAQARFSRVVWFLLLVPVVSLFVITFPFPYWDDHSHLEILMWFYVIPPMILLREYERFSRRAFLTIQTSSDGIEMVKKKMRVTYSLLSNMFPRTATFTLLNAATGGTSEPTTMYAASVLIVSDIECFTKWTAATPPTKVIQSLATLFARYDKLAASFGVEKVALVGDSYFGAIFATSREGPQLLLPLEGEDELNTSVTNLTEMSTRNQRRLAAYRVINAIMFALSMLELELPIFEELRRRLRCRIGIHIGDCVGSFVGCAPLMYDLFGEAVDTTKLHEEKGIPDQVHMSRAARSLAEDHVTLVNTTEWGNKHVCPDARLEGSVKFTSIKTKSNNNANRPHGDVVSQSGSSSGTDMTPVTASMDPQKKSELVSSALFNLIGLNIRKELEENGEKVPGSASPGKQKSPSQGTNTGTPSIGDMSPSPDADDIELNSNHSVADQPLNFKAEEDRDLSIYSLLFKSKRMERRYARSEERFKLESFGSRFWSIFEISLVIVHLFFICLEGESYTNRFITAIIAILTISFACITNQFFLVDRSKRWVSRSVLRFGSIAFYNTIPVLASFLHADCKANINPVFYTAQQVSMYYLAAMLAQQFMLSFTFWQRNAMVVLTMAIAYTVTGIRRATYKDEVMVFEISYGLCAFAVSSLSYFGEYSARTAFAAQFALTRVLKDAKSQHFDLTSNALSLMLPNFVIDKIVLDGQAMFLHENMSREKDVDYYDDDAASRVTGEGSPYGSPSASPRNPNRRQKMRERLEAYVKQRRRSSAADGSQSASDSDSTTGTDLSSAAIARSASSGSFRETMVWEYTNVSVAFISFDVGSDEISTEAVEAVDATFRDIEDVLAEHESIKIKTIGTTMLVVQGVESDDALVEDENAGHLLLMTEEERREHELRRERYTTKAMLSLTQAIKEVKVAVLAPLWRRYRIGMAAGPAFGAVIGLHGLRFDIFGDTVNTASRMMSSASYSQIQVTKSTAEILQKHAVNVKALPPKEIKGKGVIEVFEVVTN